MSVPVFIGVDGEVQGPFGVEELSARWQEGEVGPEALFWYRGRSEWRPVSEFESPRQDAFAFGARLTTAPTVAGETIQREIGIVHAQCVQGIGLGSDLAAGVRDFVGGRSQRLESLLAGAQSTALTELQERGCAMKADAVVGVRVEISEISGKGTLMLAATAYGTAVRLADRPPPLLAVRAG